MTAIDQVRRGTEVLNEVVYAAQYVRDARLIEHIDDAHLTNALDRLDMAVENVEAWMRDTE